jgi:serine/threonine-protein kinase
MPPTPEGPDRDQRIDEVLAAYYEAVEAGQPVDREGMLIRHPDLADELASFFSDKESFERQAGPLDFARPSADGDALPPALAGRCTILGEIGRGGMGVVLEAFDPDLERRVAVKVLLGRHRLEADLRRRFLDEAKITGQLQHPGVAPVYQVGRLADQRPFFTMKLIRGRTLKQILQKRASPAEGQAHLLAVFEQVCQTVAYAHAQGVIHRDLKPANVMVGAFGEVQVMDWGLAKVLPGEASRERQRPEEERGTDVPRSPEAHTQPGSVLGTPAYMPPEQARGDLDLVDERADVFGLGAILCEILTGQPPRPGPNNQAVSDQTPQRERSDARGRLAACGADEELVRLALACLAAEREARPRDAGEVAQAMAAYRAGVQERLRQAELGRVQAQARAERERHARRLTLVVGAAVLLIGLLGAGAGMWLWQQEAARAREVSGYLGEAEGWLRRSQQDKARAALDRAEARLGGGRNARPRRLQQVRSCLRMVARLEEVRLQADVGGRPFDWRGFDQGYARAFQDFGIDVGELEAEDAAERVRASDVMEQLVAALDDWIDRAANRDKARVEQLRAVVDDADGDDWRRRFRKVVRRGDRPALLALADRPEVETLPPVTQLLLSDSLRKAGEARRGVEVLRRAARRYPEDFWINYELGLRLDRLGPRPTGESLRFYQAALALRPNSPVVLTNLGYVLHVLKRDEEAEACCRKAVAIQETFATAHGNLGAVLVRRGRIDEAEKHFRRAIALEDRDPVAHFNLGVIRERRGRLDEALACFARALTLDPNFAEAHFNHGLLLVRMKREGEAVKAYRRALGVNPRMTRAHISLGRLYQRLGAREEALASFRRALDTGSRQTDALSALGAFLMGENKPHEALSCFQAAYRLENDHADLAGNLAAALAHVGRFAEAERMFRRTVALKPDHALAWNELGRVLQRQGKFQEAVAAVRRCHELGRQTPGWRHPSEEWLAGARRLAYLDRLLSAYQRGEGRLDPADVLDLACFAGFETKAHRTAARLYARALAARPAVANRVENRLRYHAACNALRAVGEAVAGLSARQRARWRKQALDWLRADLAGWEQRLTGQAPEARAGALRFVGDLAGDRDVAAVRDLALLTRLPAEERDGWVRFWQDVTALKARLGAGR